jgi:hypothetical protein
MDEDNYNDLEETIFDVLDYNISENIEFDRQDIADSFYQILSNDNEIIEEIIEEIIDSFYELFYPELESEPDESEPDESEPYESEPDESEPYESEPDESEPDEQEPDESEPDEPEDIISQKIQILRESYQPQQRTEEWYHYRHRMLTASTIWKIFKSQASLNSLIYEKCCPYSEGGKQITSSSLQWGQYFEPISIMIYEQKFSTKVEDFGCISHRDYPFLAASPDGINTLKTSSKYGTMIEVKNIVNRLITDKPKGEYWIQMQIQMEVCDLDTCDFIETRFKEYPDLETYNCDNEGGKVKGIILFGYFAGNYTPHCHRMPMDEKNHTEWIQNTIETASYSFHKIIYWYLDEFSCLSINRDKSWFNEALPKIKETWDLICSEKETGYEHRKPKSRKQIPHANLFCEEDLDEIRVIKLQEPSLQELK